MLRILQHVLVNTALLLALLVPVAHAQQLSSQPPAAPAGAPIATVNIQHAKLSREGNLFHISFDMTNRVGIQTGVEYAVELLSNANGRQAIADEKVYPAKLTLAEHSSSHQDITYAPPAGLSGTYTLAIVSQNASGFPFGIASLGNVTLASTQGIEIHTESCYLQVGSSTEKYTLRQGVDIKPSETITLNCMAENHGKATTAVPQYETHYRTLFGDIVGQSGGSTSAISFKAQETKAISIKLPKASQPQSYDVRTSLVAGSQASNAVIAHYVIQGASATIQSATLDKDSYAAGDHAVLDFVWSPSADSFPGARNAASVSATQYAVSLKSGSGADCAQPVSGSLGASHVQTAIPVLTSCTDPHLTLTLTDSSGTVYAQKEIVLQSHHRGLSAETWIIIGILLLLAITAYLLLRHGSSFSLHILLPFIVLAMAGGAAMPLHQAKADTFCSGGNHLFIDGSGSGNVWYDSCLYYYTVNIDDDTYAPGAPMQATGQVQTSMCANEIKSGGNQSKAKLTANLPSTGEQHTLVDGSPDAQSTADNPNTWQQCQQRDSCYGDPMVGSAGFTAPTTPGNYVMHFDGTGWYVSGQDNTRSNGGSLTSSSGSTDIPFTVTGPACVANQGQSCTSAANACGQTSSGTVQCDGSCSASVPQCTCPTGQTVGDQGTCVPITCPAGQVLNTSGICVPTSCPTGQVLQNDTCVPKTCPAGQALDSNGNCVMTSCPAGQTLTNGTCVATSCPAGQSLDSSGHCVQTACPTGQVLQNGVCTPITCPTGQTLNDNGICTSNSCPAGQEFNGSGVCVPITCPAGQTLDTTSNTCVAITSDCVANVGQSCSSAANTCGMTNTGGTVLCNGSCTAEIPSNALCGNNNNNNNNNNGGNSNNNGGNNNQLTLTASPTHVRKGTATLLSWNATNVQSCTVRGTNGFSSNLTSATNVNSGVINGPTVFTFTCVNNDGTTSSVSQTVQPLPVVIEQ